MRKAALGAVLDWHYAPSAVRSVSTQATLRFRLAHANAESREREYAEAEFRKRVHLAEIEEEPEKGDLSQAQQTERLIRELERALADPKIPGGMREDMVKRIGEAREDLAKIQAQREVPREVAPEERRLRFKVLRDGIGERVSTGPLRLVAVRTERVSDEAVNEVLKRAGLKVGDAITEESLKRLRAAAAGVDEHLRVVMSDDGQGGITVKIVS